MPHILFAVFLVVACATVAEAGPYEEAFSALQSKDYIRAAQLFRPLAEQGDAKAQFNLGWMYHDGQGVPQDYQAALKWYRKAAKQGNTNAQHHLGEMYQNGEGVPQDFVRAHMWFNVAVAALDGFPREIQILSRDSMASRMTAAQIQKAQEMARRCQETKFKECN